MTDRAATVGDAVARFLRTVDPDTLLRHVERLSAYDRYQASQGIEDAAALVADVAESAGMYEVRLAHSPADGAVRWWTFEAPVAWTPRRARLEVHGPGEEMLALDHGRQPMAVATHSAPTPPGGVSGPLVPVSSLDRIDTTSGAIALVAGDVFERADLPSALAAAGALGLVTDASARPARERTHRGRVEFDPPTPLFGFSVTACELDLLQRWSARGAVAHAEVAIDRTADMPLVTATLPGAGALAEEEVWLIAHLCHARPSANDNASGVAALLGIAAAHAAVRRTDASMGGARTIRCIWGPEIVGTAALLHGASRPPVAVVNLDMVGEDQRRCGGPLIVERNPDSCPGLVAPVAEAAVSEVYTRTRAQAAQATWRSAPFAGFSDHALFAGPHLGAPAVQLCHVPDRFNHSAADTPDKVCPQELARATVAGAAIALVLATDPRTARPALARALAAWCTREEELAAPATSTSAWARHRADYVRQRSGRLWELLDGAAPRAPRIHPDMLPSKGPIVARWDGPFNARALLRELSAGGGEYASLASRIRADRSLHAVLANVASRCDGTRGVREIAAETSFSLGRPLPPGSVRELVDGLLAVGWATTKPASRARGSG